MQEPLTVKKIALRLALAWLVILRFLPAEAAGDCDESFESTFAMVQELIFERRGCTAATCHVGPNPGGGLDLSRDVAWENLFEVPPVSVERRGLLRVTPGTKQQSLLWLNVASAVQPDLWKAPLRSMPLGGLPPLGLDELELLRLWIENGATRDGIVPETVGLFDVCLPPLEPLEAEPLAPPPAGVGVQIRAPRLDLPPNTETEVCFVSYYDFSDVVPRESLTEDGEFFVSRPSGGRADPLTHHQTANVYLGATPLEDPIWGPFTCKHGPRKGEPCDPREANACGEPGGCGSKPVPSVGCIGFGPRDAGFGSGNNFSIEERRQTAAGDAVSLVPVKGIVIWNSHSFNVTNFPGKVDRWLNFDFAPAADLESTRVVRSLTTTQTVAQGGAPAFGVRETCNRVVLPEGAELNSLSFHTHKRGRRWRTFRGAFECQGGPADGAVCSPFGNEGLPVEDICKGAPCAGYAPPDAGDCNADHRVSVDELVMGVNIALGERSLGVCPSFDVDDDGTVAVFELLTAVSSAIHPEALDAAESLLYVAFDYADPFHLEFDPPLVLGGRGTSARQRTLTFCALFDNGFTNPAEVVRASRRPTNASPCRPTHCAEGRVGEPCRGTGEAADRSCDSSPGAGDGHCDACRSGFGQTTDDEMFLLLGSYTEAAAA